MEAAMSKPKPSSRIRSSDCEPHYCLILSWTVLLLLTLTSVYLLFSLKTRGFCIEQLVQAPISTAAFMGDVTNSFASSSLSAFDQIQSKTYERAVRAPATTSRKAFSLKGWGRESGRLLSDSDRRLLGDVYLKANSVFEFGLGESTLIAAAVNVPRYAGVYSDIHLAPREKYQMDHFRFYFGDVGTIEKWGRPANRELNKIAYDYQISSLAAELQPFDVYMVNGRYRVACVCVSFLHAKKLGANMSQVRVGLHDADSKDRGYEVIDRIADVVEKGEKLNLYQLKETTTEKDLVRVWIDYSFKTM